MDCPEPREFVPQIRAMHQTDLHAVYRLQVQAYPKDYHESQTVFADTLNLDAGLSLVAEWRGGLCAYLLAYPWRGDPPPLHQTLPVAHSGGGFDHVFLHDLAVGREWRGRSLGRSLHQVLVRGCQQQHFNEIRLVAVSGARSFWADCGFEDCPDGRLHPSYGQGVKMRQCLSSVLLTDNFP